MVRSSPSLWTFVPKRSRNAASVSSNAASRSSSGHLYAGTGGACPQTIVKTSANGKKRSYSCNHCFSQIVVCGECGELFRRIHWNNRGCKSIVWRCISRLEPTGQECHARTVNETILENVVLAAINELLGDKPGYQEQLQQNIAVAIRSASTGTEDIDEKLMALQQELLQKANSV